MDGTEEKRRERRKEVRKEERRKEEKKGTNFDVWKKSGVVVDLVDCK